MDLHGDASKPGQQAPCTERSSGAAFRLEWAQIRARAEMMLRKWQFWTLTLLALAGVALAGMNMMLYQGNRAVQAEIAGRQQYIAQSVQLEGLYREIVKALADLSVKAQDGDLRNLLAGQGITVSTTSSPPPSPSEATNKVGK